MGKTADRYCEGASKTLQTKASGSLATKLFQVSSFFVTDAQKALRIVTKISKNPSKSLKIL